MRREKPHIHIIKQQPLDICHCIFPAHHQAASIGHLPSYIAINVPSAHIHIIKQQPTGIYHCGLLRDRTSSSSSHRAFAIRHLPSCIAERPHIITQQPLRICHCALLASHQAAAIGLCRDHQEATAERNRTSLSSSH